MNPLQALAGRGRRNIFYLIHRIFQDVVMEIKNQVEKVYGPKWNVFIASGRYWSVCTHKAGGNLVFAYKGAVYGIYQTPERNVEDSPFANNTSYAGVSSAH